MSHNMNVQRKNMNKTSCSSNVTKREIPKEITKIPALLRPITAPQNPASSFLKPISVNKGGAVKTIEIPKNNFLIRKSSSMMDIARKKKPITHSIPNSKTSCSTRTDDSSSSQGYKSMAQSQTKKRCEHQKHAMWRIFALLMLNSWRKRREGVFQLKGQITILEKKLMHQKDVAHSLQVLYQKEARKCETLLKKLNDFSEENKIIRSEYDNLHKEKKTVDKKLQDTVIDKQVCELQVDDLKLKNEELECKLQQEWEKVLELENEKSELIDELDRVNFEINQKELQFEDTENKFHEEITLCRNHINVLEVKMSDLKGILSKNEDVIKELTFSTMSSREENKNLNELVVKLQGDIHSSFQNRLKRFCMIVPTYTIGCLQTVAFFLLPGPSSRNLCLPRSSSVTKNCNYSNRLM